MTFDVITSLGNLTIREMFFTLGIGVILGMLLDRLGNRIREREINEQDEGGDQ